MKYCLSIILFILSNSIFAQESIEFRVDEKSEQGVTYMVNINPTLIIDQLSPGQIYRLSAVEYDQIKDLKIAPVIFIQNRSPAKLICPEAKASDAFWYEASYSELEDGASLVVCWSLTKFGQRINSITI